MPHNAKKLTTDAYKGVRDFLPADMAIQKAIFSLWRGICEKYGYEEYGSSVLEPADLYRAKTGEEIINEQTYTFTDRGDREVTLRPEMTPTAARMVAGRRRDLIFPLRWYSIPNLFRYEQPQRGRLREHWQLNVDIFGVEGAAAEIEIINMAFDITRAYGLKDTNFEIRLNNRKLMNYITKDVFSLSEELSRKVAKLIDRKDKLDAQSFNAALSELFAPDPHLRGKDEQLLTLLNSGNFEEFISHLPQTAQEHAGLKEIREVISGLERLGITNVRFDQTLMRGFDYYTGTVFEVFDLNPANRRSVFGGGRYDELLSLFGNDKVAAFGFGAGDVIARDLMETYGTLPKPESPADVCICIVGDQNMPYSLDLAQKLRSEGVRVAVDFSGKKVGDQIANADKRGIKFMVAIGDQEVTSGSFKLKNLKTKEEKVVDEDGLISEIRRP
ncbi:MAG: histidine--tRNA ligase [Patescibacteria group bacterium]|nr:histidine--tRNA ligase [Patescibacteria group bacterium]